MKNKNPFLAINIEPDLLSKIDDFRFKHRFPSRVETVKWLLKYALSQKLARQGQPLPEIPAS